MFFYLMFFYLSPVHWQLLGARQYCMGLKITVNPSQRVPHYRIIRPRVSRKIRALVDRSHSTRIEKNVLDSAWQANRQEDRQEMGTVQATRRTTIAADYGSFTV